MEIVPNRATELYGRPWRPRELVIALNAYFKHRGKPAHIGADWIREVSRILGRTPASVLMRMANFESLDPKAKVGRQGLAKGGPLCEKTFWRWYDKIDQLESTANFLIEDIDYHDQELDLFDPAPVRLPKAFGKYELLDPLGSGGFGSVYSCIAADDSEPRALKVIKTDMVADKEVLHRFYREIRALKAIQHSNVIRIYEDNLELESELPGFVMDLAERNLAEYVKEHTRYVDDPEERTRIGPHQATEIINSMLNAVEVLHKHQPSIVHRDLNPHNILLLPDGRWVLADFGLAKFVHVGPLATAFETGTQVAGIGTSFYAAPEQWKNFRSCRAYTDIYALGMLIWDLFSSNGPPPDRMDTGLSPSLTQVFLKATERRPEARYQNVAEMRLAFLSAV